jgi:hypothetical protein
MRRTLKSDYSDYNSSTAKLPLGNTFEPLCLDKTLIANKQYQERYRQAKLGFNSAVSLTVATSILSIAVAVSVCMGNVPAATATAVMGITCGVNSKRLFDISNDANKRLDETAREFLDE